MMRGAWTWLIFLGLAAAVSFPWFLEPGFLFLLDFVWTPEHRVYTEFLRGGFLTGVLPEWLLTLLSRALPTPLVQKIAFLVPLVLSGVAMTHLVRWLLRDHPAGATTLAALTAGVFYTVNPFSVTRMVMGQYYLLLGYALTPWAFLAVLQFLTEPTRGRALLSGVALTGTILANAHHLVLQALLILPWLLLLRRRHARSLPWLLAPLLAFLLLSMVSYRAGQASPPDPRGPWARALQAPFTGNLIADSLLLTATWKTNGEIALPYEFLPGFGLFGALLLTTMLIGAIGHRTDAVLRGAGRRLLVVMGLATLLAIGVAHPLTEPVTAWLYRHVPFFLGMRDSAKFLALVALGESVLLGLGTATLAERLAVLRVPRALRRIAPRGVLVCVIVLASPTFRGFAGQVTPREYPESWTQWNVKLSTLPERPRMLFLPWHQYLAFSFTSDRTIFNPAPRFFTNAEVIAGDNSEVGGIGGTPFIYSESTRPLSRTVEAFLRDAPARTDFGSRLASEEIRYVALALDTPDADQYAFLRDQRDLRRVFVSPELTVWEIR